MINAEKLVKETSELTRFGRFDEANSLLGKALRDDPECFEARLEQIRVALFQDKIDEAFKLIGKAAEIRPNDPRLVALQGVWFLENKQFQGAATALNWAAKTMPKDSLVWLNLAIALRNLGDLKGAEEQILKSLTINPLSDMAHYEYSRILALTGRMPDAMMHVLESIKINPYFILGYMALTRFFKSQNKLDAAIKLYEVAIKIAPDVDFFYGQLAVLHEEKGDYASALKYAEHLAKTNNSYYDHLRVGIYTLLLGRIAEAEKIFLKCVERSPTKWDAYYNLGEIKMIQHNIAEAAKYYQKAIERVGTLDSKPYNGLGVTQLLQGHPQKAQEYFRKALQINPKSFEATLNTALVFKTLKDAKSAREWANKALSLDENDAVKIKKVEHFLQELGQNTH